MPWMKWVPLQEALKGEGERKLPKDAGGIYEIAVERPIRRLLGTDTDGILMIGQTTGKTQSLFTRVRAFRESAFNGKERHSEGMRFSRLKLARESGPLRVRWVKTRSRNPLGLEQKLLKKYQVEFGELPPLNNSGGV